MPRRSGRTTRGQVDYRALTNISTRVRVRLNSTTVPTTGPCSNPPTQTQQEEEPAPALPEGLVQCTYCKMQFTAVSLASQKHNRHHPDCQLFERKTSLSDKDLGCLRYDALLSWVGSLKCKGLQEQLKKYYQKSSGKKVMQIM